MSRSRQTREQAIESLRRRLEAGSVWVDGCRVWQKHTSGANEYGAINFPRRFADFVGQLPVATTAWVPIPVARASMALKLGGLTAEQKVLHRCDNQLCSAEDHLFLGTQLDNMRDKIMKGRQAQGEMIAQAKLTATQVAEIRQLVAAGITQTEVAKRFHVYQSNVSRIVNFKSRRVA